MRLTDKQLELMRVIISGNEDGSPTDLDQIIERVSYQPTKQSIQFSIRALVKHELIEKLGGEKRRGRYRVIIAPTPLGKHFAVPSLASPLIEPENTIQLAKVFDLG